jgi:hypothetical protein
MYLSILEPVPDYPTSFSRLLCGPRGGTDVLEGILTTKPRTIGAVRTITLERLMPYHFLAMQAEKTALFSRS